MKLRIKSWTTAQTEARAVGVRSGWGRAFQSTDRLCNRSRRTRHQPTNPLGDDTTYGYNAANELVGATNALGYTTTYGYDAASEKITATNPLNQTTTYSYTLLGQLAATTDPLGDIFSYSYNANGDNSAITQSGPSQPAQTTNMGYNALNQQTSSTNPLGYVTSIGYDPNGNLRSYTDPNGNKTQYSYNAINELTGVTNALNQTTTYGYNANGNRTSATDPLGNTTSYTFDAQGRTLTATAANGGVTGYKYDVAGNLLSLTDPVGNVTSYSYNAVNELMSTTNPLGSQSTNAYNAAGELTSATDANGHTIDYSYNAVGEQTSQTWVGGNYTATYDYNAADQLTSASDPFSSYTYTYDAAGRETSVSNAGTPGVPTVTLSFGYDAYNNRTSLTDSLGGSLSYTFDARQLLTGETLSLNGTTTASVGLSYNAASQLTNLTRSTPSGITISTSLSYDNINRLTSLGYTNTSSGATLAYYQYGYNAASQLTSYQDNSNNSLSYTYDKIGELTGATGTLNGSNYSVSYSYDANGNRTMSGYVTGTGNELKSDGTYNYTYDKNGNTLTQTNIATGAVTYYTWDYENRLTEVKQETSTGTVINDEKFTYDVFGNRIGVSLNGTQQLYTVYDGSNPYMDFNGSGQLTQRYLTNPNALSQYYGQVNASGTTQWFLTDNINSIRQVISASGTSLDAITYDPFGNIVSQTNAANAPRMMYAGGANDSLMGTTLFDKRYYNSGAGDWMSSDPSSFAAGDSNLYRYAFNQPTDAIDPTGLSSWGRFLQEIWDNPGVELRRGLQVMLRNPFGYNGGPYGESSSGYSGNVGMGGVLSPMYYGGGNASGGGNAGSSGGGGMSTNFFGAIPNNGNGGDLIGQYEASYAARMRMEAMGMTPPPTMWGTSVPAYGMDGNKTFAGAMAQGGQMTQQMMLGKGYWGWWRLPDYATLNISAGSWLGWSGQITIDRNGNFYYTPIGGYVGVANSDISGSVSANWLNQLDTPSSDQLGGFLTGKSYTIGGGFVVGGAVTHAPGNDVNAVGIGLYTPQASGSESYQPPSWQFNIPGMKW